MSINPPSLYNTIKVIIVYFVTFVGAKISRCSYFGVGRRRSGHVTSLNSPFANDLSCPLRTRLSCPCQSSCCASRLELDPWLQLFRKIKYRVCAGVKLDTEAVRGIAVDSARCAGYRNLFPRGSASIFTLSIIHFSQFARPRRQNLGVLAREAEQLPSPMGRGQTAESSDGW